MHKPVIRKFEKHKVYSSFKDNIWGSDLADMQIISKYNKGFWFSLCVIERQKIPLKDKKGITISNVVKIFLDYSNRKLSKIWAD